MLQIRYFLVPGPARKQAAKLALAVLAALQMAELGEALFVAVLHA